MDFGSRGAAHGSGCRGVGGGVGGWGSEKVFLGSVTSTLMQGNLIRVCQVSKHRKRTPGKRNSRERGEGAQM